MSTSSINEFSRALSTLDDSAPLSRWFTLGQRLPRPLGSFIREGRWRVGWMIVAPTKSLESIGDVEHPQARTATQLTPLVVPRPIVAPRAPAFTLPAPFQQVLSFLFSALLHATVVIVLAWIGIATPAGPQVVPVNAQFLSQAEIEPPALSLAVNLGYEPALQRWEVLASALEDFTSAGSAAAVTDQALEVALGSVVYAARGPVGEIRAFSASSKPGDWLGTAPPSVEFYGIPAAGQRFVFVVDASRSMNGAKWEQAQQELLRAVEQLGPQREFYVILFDAAPHPMFHDRRHEAQPLPATPQNIARLQGWLTQHELGYNTSPCLAVKHGLDLQPDAIFLVTDGEFNDPTAGYLRENNRTSQASGPVPRIAVHTISLGAPGEKLLARIARENGGTFRKIVP